jgi:hypothetical protein
MEAVRSLLHTGGFPPNFWAEACHTVVYTLNRTGSRLIPGNTPFTLWHGFKPSLEHLRIFGCHAYAYIDKQHRTKLDPKSHLCFFLGYCDNTKGYRLWDPVTSKVLLRRDVIFNEQLLYGSLEEQSSSSPSDNLPLASLSLTSPPHSPAHSSSPSSTTLNSPPSESTLTPASDSIESFSSIHATDSPAHLSTENPSFPPLTPRALLSHPNYQTDTPVRLRSLAELEHSASQSSPFVPTPSSTFAHLSHTFSDSSQVLSTPSLESSIPSSQTNNPITTDFSPDDPFTYLEALYSPDAAKWVHAMTEEVNSLKENTSRKHGKKKP